MDRILIILKKENGPRASSAPELGLNTIIFKHVYWYMQQTQVSVYRTIGPLVSKFFAQHIQCILPHICNRIETKAEFYQFKQLPDRDLHGKYSTSEVKNFTRVCRF